MVVFHSYVSPNVFTPRLQFGSLAEGPLGQWHIQGLPNSDESAMVNPKQSPYKSPWNLIKIHQNWDLSRCVNIFWALNHQMLFHLQKIGNYPMQPFEQQVCSMLGTGVDITDGAQCCIPEVHHLAYHGVCSWIDPLGCMFASRHKGAVRCSVVLFVGVYIYISAI